MKTKFITIILIIISCKVFSQSTYSTSTYTPSPVNVEYYRALAERRQKELSSNFENLNKLINESLEVNTDDEFKNDIYEVRSYVTVLERDMSLEQAESYLNKAYKLYNKAVKNYNKRLEKINQNNSSTSKTQPRNDSNENHFQKGFECYKNKEFLNSITEFTKYLEIDKTNTDAMFFRALAKSELKDRYGAINDYERIIELNSEYPMRYGKLSTIYNNKAYCLVGLNKYQEALPFVEKALELDKTEYYIWDTRGEIYYNLGNFDKCILDMTKALSIKENDNSFYYRGLSEIQLGQKVNGCKDLSKSGELGNEKAYEEISKNCN
jgi:tetratricopeptide (TPR) repeat protein